MPLPDSLIADAELADPAIAKLPAHKVNKAELRKEETLAPDATEKEIKTVQTDDDKLFTNAENEAETWNKEHGFKDPKESLLQEAEDVDPSIAKLPAHKTNKKELKKEETLGPDATTKEVDTVEDNDFSLDEQKASEWNAQHGFKDPKETLLQEAEDVDPAIAKLPAHKVNQKELKQEETLGAEATPEEIHTVESNKLHQAEVEAAKWNKEHGF
ncbi:uncharacterized protein KGF55_001940 [Candida pseudojiufengensis]|uniref:uncharacterized protein n=1 Tax=Candida pseudojiufengensis TaxID=497109 RepID=UPI0022241C2A|nr:uncharacterized protein KGF55_001940 [Candida pseudojiufengensis]KAI5964869.1 hypothetical protein KGF55_001940 [Candida pseudojiufengensis]